MVFKLGEWGAATVSLFFIYLFLPLSLFFFYALPTKWRSSVLLTISAAYLLLVAPRQLPVILAMSTASYLLTKQIFYLSAKRSRLLLLTLCCGLNGGVWIVFGIRYWFADLPYLLGAAVFPLLAIDTAVDIYRNPTDIFPGYFRYLSYCLFFPRLYIGPFETIRDFTEATVSTQPAGRNLLIGAGQLVRGAFQFSFLGMRLMQLADRITSFPTREITGLSSWIMVVLLGLGIYHILAGFSLIARGIGVLFQMPVPLDTQYPLQANTVQGFVRRYHMSLYRFVERTIYRPLSRRIPYPLRGLLTLLCGGLLGLWFEFSWALFVWGIFLALFMLLEQRFFPQNVDQPPLLQSIATKAVVLLSFAVMAWGRTGWSSAFFAGLVGKSTESDIANPILYFLTSNIWILLLALVFATDLPSRLVRQIRQIFPTYLEPLKDLFQIALFVVLTALLT